MRTKMLLTTILSLAPLAVSAQTLDGQMQTMHPMPMAAPANMQPVDSIGGDAIPALPLQVQSANNITYINGGIGDEEMAQLKAKSADYNMHVMLSAPTGEYISDVTLSLIDASGNVVVSVSDAGPYFYAHVTPGTYTLETSIPSEAVAKKTTLVVPASGIAKTHIMYNQ